MFRGATFLSIRFAIGVRNWGELMCVSGQASHRNCLLKRDTAETAGWWVLQQLKCFPPHSSFSPSSLLKEVSKPWRPPSVLAQGEKHGWFLVVAETTGAPKANNQDNSSHISNKWKELVWSESFLKWTIVQSVNKIHATAVTHSLRV